MASSREIQAGKAVVILGMDSSPLQRELDVRQKQLAEFGKGVAAFGAGLSAAGASVTAPMLYGLQVFSDMGGGIAKAARISGMGIADLQTLSAALRVDFDELAKGSRKMDQFISQAAAGSPDATERLNRLGLSLHDLANMSEADRFRAIGQAISRTYGDISQRHAEALAIFGRGGLQFDFSGDVGAREDRQRKLGGVMSDADVALAKEYNAAVREMGVATQGLWARIGATAAPAMRDFFNLITWLVIRGQEFVDANRPMLEVVFRIADAMVAAGAIVVAFGGAFYGASAVVGFFMPMISALSIGVGILTGALAMLPIAAGVAALALAAIAGFGLLAPEVTIDATPPPPVPIVAVAPAPVGVPIIQPAPVDVAAVPPAPVDVPVNQPADVQIGLDLPPQIEIGQPPPVIVDATAQGVQVLAAQPAPVPIVAVAPDPVSVPVIQPDPVDVAAVPPAPVDVPVNQPAPVSIETIPPPPVPIVAVAPEPVNVPIVQPAPVDVAAVPPAPVDVPVNQPAPVSIETIPPPPVPIVAVAPEPVNVPIVQPDPVDVAAMPPAPVDVPVNQPAPVGIQVNAPTAVTIETNAAPVDVEVNQPAPVTVDVHANTDSIFSKVLGTFSNAYERLAAAAGAPLAMVVTAAVAGAGAYAVLTAGVMAWGWATAAAGGVASAATWAWGLVTAAASTVSNVAMAVATAAVWAYNFALGIVNGTAIAFRLTSIAAWAASMAAASAVGMGAGMYYAHAAASGVAAAAMFLWGAAVATVMAPVTAFNFLYAAGIQTIAVATALAGGIAWAYNAALAAGAAGMAFLTAASAAATAGTGAFSFAEIVAAIETAVLSGGVYLLVAALGALVIAELAVIAALPIAALGAAVYLFGAAAAQGVASSDAVGSAWNATSGEISRTFTSIFAGGAAMFSGLTSTAVTSFNAIKDAFSAGNFELIWEIAKVAAQLAWIDIKTFGLDAWVDLKYSFFDVWDAIADGMEDGFAGAMLGIKNAFTNAVTVMRAAWWDFVSETTFGEMSRDAAANARRAERQGRDEIDARNARAEQTREDNAFDRARRDVNRAGEREHEHAEAREGQPEERQRMQGELDDLSMIAAMEAWINSMRNVDGSMPTGSDLADTGKDKIFGTFSAQAAFGMLGASETPAARQARLQQMQIDQLAAQHAALMDRMAELIRVAGVQFA